MRPSIPGIDSMLNRRSFVLAATASLLLLLAPWGHCAEEPSAADQIQFFESKVRPLLVEHCFKCHAQDQQKGGLRLDSRGQMLLGGDSGPAIVPGNIDESLLLAAVRYESFEMPPAGKLPDPAIEILTAWIKSGAFWPGDDGQVARRTAGKEFTAEDRAWWSFQPVRDPQLPKVSNEPWCRNEIDYFIAQMHARENLTPAPEASRESLIRRVYFDLIGLPPTPEEVQSFVNDRDEYAYERLVDSLLNRPEYGERWARHWLDLVRYADSDGYRADFYRPQAWRYRDYVIDSFNDDKPYDRFIQEQIAADELFPDDPQALVGTGFLRHWIYEYNARDVRGQWNVILNDITDSTSDVFLGLGLQCARCHDHKYDPLLQVDYFRLRAFFEPLLPRDDVVAATPEEKAAHAEKLKHYEDKTAELRAELKKLEDIYRERGRIDSTGRFPDDIQAMMHKPEAERAPLEKQLAALAWVQILYEYDRIDNRMSAEDKEKVLALRRELAKFSNELPPALPTPMTVTDVGPVSTPTVVPKKGTEVEPGFPTILQDQPAEILSVSNSGTTGRRATLAKWMTRPDNPLTTRVIVNRIWQHHFGRGLVENSSDFGKLGVPPTHPELLDWLTTRFVKNGWHFKDIHRLIVTSATYRQSSTHPQYASCQIIDPANIWLWRGSTRRLDAEQIRDSIFSVTGQLVTTRHGPGVQPDQPRRSIYTRIMRNSRDPLLDVFDLPQFFNSTPSRDTTTSPVQSLLLINSQTMLDHADRLARRVDASLAESEQTSENRIRQLWRIALGREPTLSELETSQSFLEQQVQAIRNEDNAEVAPQVATGKMPYRDGQALLLAPGKKQDLLSIDHDDVMNTGDFTVEAFFQLRSIFDSGEVRTLISKIQPKTNVGWAMGVTGKGSRRKPQTVVMQIIGSDLTGKVKEAAIFSDQHVEMNKPYYVAVSVQLATPDRRGMATFYLKDLSNDDEPLQVAELQHDIVDGIGNVSPILLGSRETRSGAFDGLIDDVRISRGVLNRTQLLYTVESVAPETVGYWQFEPTPGLMRDSSPSGLNIRTYKAGAQTKTPEQAAFADLCHIILNSNEFLYVD